MRLIIHAFASELALSSSALTWAQEGSQSITQTTHRSLKPEEVYAIARDAYLYAYPIVSMDATMRQATNVPDAKTINMRAPVNQFAHARAYPRADEKDVVRFNFDTLYSLAWLGRCIAAVA